MADVHVIDALAGETGGDLLPVLFNVQHERQKPFYGRGVDIYDLWISALPLRSRIAITLATMADEQNSLFPN